MASDTLWKGYVLPQNTQSSGGVSRRGGASAQSRGSSSARCRRLAAWSHHFPPKVTTNQKRVVLFFFETSQSPLESPAKAGPQGSQSQWQLCAWRANQESAQRGGRAVGRVALDRVDEWRWKRG